MGKNVELLGSNYKTGRDNLDLPLTGPSFSEETSHHLPNTDKEDLDSEMMMLAMLFSSMDIKPETENELENDQNKEDLFHVSKAILEECMGSEGLKYFGGYIAHKFPQYDLGKKNVKVVHGFMRFQGRRVTYSHQQMSLKKYRQ